MATEHGLSIWLTAGEKHILFDTGMGPSLPGNAIALGVDLRQTDAVVLSHGHSDHTGGIPHVFECGMTAPIFMHPDAIQMRYRRLDAPPHKPIGMRPDVVDSVCARSADIVPALEPTRIMDGVWITGPIPRRTTFEDTGGPFFIDAECLVMDPLTDDQAMWLETGEGIAVILGCAHSGVVNTLDYIAELTGATRFHSVIGGMHLIEAREERIAATVDALNRYQVKRLAPCHCTGEPATSILSTQFREQYVCAGAGTTFAWPTAVA